VFNVSCPEKPNLADIAVFEAENADVRKAALAGGLRNQGLVARHVPAIYSGER
jgi:hypothetical protein